MGLSFPGTGLQFTKLWTNPKPTETFSKQDIMLDLTGYDAVYIAIRSGASAMVLVGQDLNDTTMNAWGNGNIGATYSLQSRRFNVKTDRVTVQDCAFVNGNSPDGTTANNWSVPVAIYGVNFGG